MAKLGRYHDEVSFSTLGYSGLYDVSFRRSAAEEKACTLKKKRPDHKPTLDGDLIICHINYNIMGMV